MKPHAASKFAKFLRVNKIPKRKAARDLGVSAPTLLGWLEGKIVPEQGRRPAIRVYTRGAVVEDDWVTKHEREVAARAATVRPFDEPEPASERVPKRKEGAA